MIWSKSPRLPRLSFFIYREDRKSVQAWTLATTEYMPVAPFLLLSSFVLPNTPTGPSQMPIQSCSEPPSFFICQNSHMLGDRSRVPQDSQGKLLSSQQYANKLVRTLEKSSHSVPLVLSPGKTSTLEAVTYDFQ